MLQSNGWHLPLTLAQDANAPTPAAPSEGGNGNGGNAPAPGPDGTTAQPAPGQGSGNANAPGLEGILFPILLMVAIMWVLLILPQRREKKKRAQMMNELKKGAKVQTVGGILGTIVELKEHEVVIKIDESTNTRMRFTRGAIHSILPDGKPTEDN